MKTNEITVRANCFSEEDTIQKNKMTGLVLTGLLVAALMMIVLVPVNAMAARERFVLDYNDSQIRGHKGQPSTIFLKKSLKQQYPHAAISRMELRRVVVVVKSKKGKGGAQLRVGNRATPMYRVDGHPGSFKKNRGKSFDRINFRNPSNDSRGPWQVNLKGNCIVRKVVLEVENHSRPQRHFRWLSHNW